MWFYAFNVFTGRSFSKESFIQIFKFWLNENNYKVPPEGTLNRDFLCLSNMYSRFKIAADDEYENTLTCPFKDLRIINYDKLSKHYNLRSIKTKEFSVHLFAFCLLRFMDKEDNAITINTLLNDPLSPGQIFRLTEDCLLDYLIDFIAAHKGVFEFDDTIGNKQLLIKKQVDLDATSFEHFKKVSDK